MKKSPDWETKKFRELCIQDDIPEKWIDSSRWVIEPVRVLGGGNLQQEQAQAQAMLNIRPMLNPEAQQEVLNDYVFSITHDPKRAARLAPLEGAKMATNTVHDTELTFGALMSGSKVSPKSGLIPAEVCTTMLMEMGAKVQEINARGGMATPDQVIGLQNASRYTGFYIQQLAQDETMKPQAKQFADALKNIDNMIKAFAQRLQQQAEAAAKEQQNAAAQENVIKLQGMAAQNQQKLAAKTAHDRQKMTSKQVSDMQKQTSKRAADAQKLAQKQVEFDQNLELSRLETEAQIENDRKIAAAKAAKEIHIEQI